jgi:hypothetical protein
MSKNENKPNKKEHFNVPKGYFQKSGEKIFNKIEWEDEMKPFSTLLKLKGQNGFNVPENYFSHNELMLENLDFEKLNAIPKINSFQTPQNYFKENEISLSSILDENAEHSSLNIIQKENSFKIPDKYFEKNEVQIQHLLSKNKSAKILNLSFSKIAFAAAALIVITLAIAIYSNYTKVVPSEDCSTLACIEKRELLKSKQIENLDDDELYELVNPLRLEEDLNETKSKNIHQINIDSNNNKLSDDLLDEI